MRPKASRAPRGVALVGATAGVALLSAVALGLATTAASGDRLAAAALARAQAEALARSGVAGARAGLLDAAHAAAPDTLDAPWLRPLDPQALGSGVVRVEVEDEARRLDPNRTPEAIAPLLARLGLAPAAADALLDWIDADDRPRPHGAERPWYAARGLPGAPANRPLRAPGEMLLVRGFDAAALARLRPLLTTAGEDGVNPNTAAPDVMLALWDAARVGEILAARGRGPVACDDLPHCTTRSTTYRVRATGAVGATAHTVEAQVRVVAGLGAEVVAWREGPGAAAP